VAPAVPSVAAELGALTGAWPALVAVVRSRSRFLGEALDAAPPSALELPWLTVTLRESNPLFAERLQEQAPAIEDILRQATGQALRLKVTEAALPDGEPPRPRKLSEASIKADRLKQFRAKDPSLDTAANELDLEIVD